MRDRTHALPKDIFNCMLIVVVESRTLLTKRGKLS